MNANVRLKISPPWITYLNQIKVMFGNDPDIDVTYDNDEKEIKLLVNNSEKAEAISNLLPVEKTFGNVKLKITVVPANGQKTNSGVIDYPNLFDIAFDRNPIYAFSKQIDGIWFPSCTYVVFKNKVVQFFNDNLNDIHGNVTTLYENIARDLFAESAQDLNMVYFCTDIEEKVGKPLGEWP